MSTLELEHIKHTSSSNNNLSVHSDGSLTLGSLNGNIHVGTMGVGHTAIPTSYGDSNTMFSIHKNTTSGSVNALIGTDTVKGGMYVNNAGSDNEIKFGTTSNYPTKLMANGVTGVEVNGCGMVLKPAVPMFVSRDDRSGVNMTNEAHLNISRHFRAFTGHNRGSCFASRGSTNEGRFTAPVNGFYMFGWNLFTTGTSADASSRVGINLNGGTSEWSGGDRVGHANQGSILLYMNANDYVTLGTQGGSYTAYWYATSSQHSRFWGFLVG